DQADGATIEAAGNSCGSSGGKAPRIGIDDESPKRPLGHNAGTGDQYPDRLNGVEDLYRRAFGDADRIAGSFGILMQYRGILETASPQIQEILEMKRRRMNAAELIRQSGEQG